jgi:two-component system, cell cycle sensor histidine kinase and response regulator CckA
MKSNHDSEATDPRGEPEGRLAQGAELVLVVDDHPSVLEAVRLLLECQGHRVLVAAQGSEAIDICCRHRGEIAFVVTDMMMPGMDGVATIRKLREVDAALEFIGISGAVDPARLREFAAVQLVALLQKPFGAEEMMEALGKARQRRAAKVPAPGASPPAPTG